MTTASINLVTGVNGSGKTLWLLQEVEQLRKDTNRSVYFWRIPGLIENRVLPWTEITETQKVHDLPTGSIIVIDEAHKIFPQRGPSTSVPLHVAPFDECRHRGHTFYLITQRPTEIDHYIRGRVGRHVHFKRVFGMERSRRFEWQELGNPSDDLSMDKAAGSEFAFPKHVYSWYKSSDSHQIQKKLPWQRFSLFPLGLAAVAALLYLAVSSLRTDDQKAHSAAQAEGAPREPLSPAVETFSDPRRQGLEWAAQFVERVEGQPHSPQFYDASLKPATLPKISGCGMIETPKKSRCWCNTQQGTIVTTISYDDCKFYLANGWFDPTKPDFEDSESDNNSRGTAPIGPSESPAELFQIPSPTPS